MNTRATPVAAWSDAWGGLRWLDMPAGDVLPLAPLPPAPDGTVARRNVGTTFGGPPTSADRSARRPARTLDPGAEPEAGALFARTPGVSGVPVREFAR